MHVDDVKERILAALRKKEKMPIYQVAREARLSVATTSKYCYILAAENRIIMESFGNMKLVSRR
jgi:hypothetical protein